MKGYLLQGDINGDGAADFSLQIYTSPTKNLAGGSAGWNLAAWILSSDANSVFDLNAWDFAL
ncbi:hypothetical protein [Bradyrhizobium sp. sBnM-33]|uniref:hypothetical protein n=1 Tax=Bradyrhizobium sp. sBnM-33 TaxID=2831780 RepID=UPI001BCD3915|nr:hypothetical protein [Bradyrhizobium sp. sBnM-33]WOH48863.1 hypothetical protein RX328_32950 [Bradyrhizobium sp. sBnM-33]